MKKNEFEILYYLLNHEPITQRAWADKLQISLGSVNKLMNRLKEAGYVGGDGRVTISGKAALKPYKVDNAVIMAAGMSSRFAPLSFEKPKGLLRVKGDILIERQIEQLLEAGIKDIIVVIGYRKEMFFYLEEKYGVKLVVNEDYYKYNNPSTLLKVKESIGNTYICSSDDYFTENVFEPYVYDSYYAVKYADGPTDEYCVSFDGADRINKVVIGGKDRWYMLGHVYFSKDFSRKFLSVLECEYQEEENRKLLWEQIYMKHIKELDMYVRRYEETDIFEFDSLDELRFFDPHYVSNTDSKIIKNICDYFECDEHEIHDIVPLKQGMTNLSFRFTLRDRKYVYRHPGVGTEEYINRKSEEVSMQVAKQLHLDDTFLYMDKEEGWKISSYLENARTLDYHNDEDVSQALGLMRTLHQYPGRSEYVFELQEKIEEFVRLLRQDGRGMFEDFNWLYEKIQVVYELVRQDAVPTCICHGDCFEPNFLVDEGGKMYLIDWEYSGTADAGVDLGTFICCSDYSYEEALSILRKYYESPDMTELQLRHALGYVALASFYWFVWAIYQECNGNVVGEYLLIWYKYSKKYAQKVIELYKEEADGTSIN